MDKLPETTTGQYERALMLKDNGYRLVALKPRTKVPVFKGFQTRRYEDHDLYHLFEGTDLNVGILCGGDLVVLDIDSALAADLDWVLEHVGDTPMKVQSPSGGIHL